MNKKYYNDDWTEVVTPVLRGTLKKSSLCCYRNACEILEEALILFDKERYSRSSALAILAEEEFGKAFFLANCAFQDRWDSVIWRALTGHGEKQAISEGMIQLMEFMGSEIVKSPSFSKLQRQQTISRLGHLYLNKDNVNQIIEPIKRKYIKKRQRDKLKQNFLYVSINKEGAVISSPGKGIKRGAEKGLKKADGIKKIVELQYKEINLGF